MQQTRAMPPLGLLRRRHSLSSVSSTFPAPTFTAAFFSLSCVPPRGREEGTLSQVNARRSPGRRERESPVLQSRSDGPEGRSSLWTLRTIPRDLLLRSFFLAILLTANSHLIPDISRFLPLFVVFRHTIAIGSPYPRALAHYRYRQFVSVRVSSVPFRSVK